jgi:hypothetical protein
VGSAPLGPGAAYKGEGGRGGMQRRPTGGNSLGVGALARPRMGGATSECEFGVMV